MEAFVFVLYYSNMRNAATAPAIRVYNLFGESGDLPDVVHCETIASRSVLHAGRWPCTAMPGCTRCC